MSRTQPAYVTEETYQYHRARQDTDIRGEFGRQASLIEQGNRQLRTDLTTTFNDKLSNVNGTLSGRIGELSNTVQQVKDEVHQVKARLDHIEDDVGEMKARLNQMEGRSFNRSRVQPRHTLSVIGTYKPGVGFMLPDYFPPTINDFWKLQFPSQGM